MALTKVYTNMIADTAISVQSFGAKGDGTTDDSAAINASLTALGYAYLSQPATSYYVASPILVGLNQQVFGDGNAEWQDQEASTFNNPTILSARGIPAIWVQDSGVIIKNLSICIDKTTLTDFSNTADVGVLIQATNVSSSLAPASWDWVENVTVENVSISRAYLSIQMEAVYEITLKRIYTGNDRSGIAYNYFQRQVYGPTGALPKYATTMWFSDISCNGLYPTPVTGGFGLWGDQTFGLSMTNVISEGYDTCMYFFNTHSGSLRNLYAERCNIGVQLIGNLSPFVVESPYILFTQSSDSAYAFRSEFGTIVFIGGEASLKGGSSVFFSPTDTTGTCTFLSKPALSGGSLTPVTTTNYFVNGLFNDNSLVVNGGLYQLNNFGAVTSGTPVQISAIASAATGGGGGFVITGYSLTGNYLAFVLFMPGTVVKVSETNNTGGTIAYSTSGNALYITSTGTSSQILEGFNVSGPVC